ncbi:MAG: hypothetical protein ACRDJH_03900 [Thermomicrobiales bacterium]
MDHLLGQMDGFKTSGAVVARVLVDAKRAYTGLVDEAFLERCAREAVEELWGDAIKVRSFVPVLAYRRVRDIVEAHQIANGHLAPLA